MTPEQLAASGTEDGAQMAFFAWLNGEMYAGRLPRECELIHAIPNGGLRDPRTAARLKATGTKSGVPDIFVPIPRYNSAIPRWFLGCYLEVKRPESIEKKQGLKRRAGVVSDEQTAFMQRIYDLGYETKICIGYEQLRDTFLTYYNQR